MAALSSHPYGVEPEGNLLLQTADATAAAHSARRTGLGMFSRLDDATLLKVCSYAEPRSLMALCVASDTLRAFASFEELWRSAVLSKIGSKPLKEFSGSSWKATYHALAAGRFPAISAISAAAAAAAVEPRTRGVSIYSDALFLPHELTHGPTKFGKVPRGPPIARLAPTASPDVPSFSREFEAGVGKPVVIEGAGSGTVGAGSSSWDEASLVDILGQRVFHAGGVNFHLADYFKYASSNQDDQPLYLFDPTFGASAPELLGLYEPPAYFRDDLFSLLEQRAPTPAAPTPAAPTPAAPTPAAPTPLGPPAALASTRPDYRWLLIGGARSGQSWHKDPNGTSAWNLTLRGRKRWLFFPPNVTPPGVFPSADGRDFVTPYALAEWGRDFYAEACRTPGFVEAETGPGDVTFVPRGWWHMVLNVAPLTIAVSHHFLSPAGLHTTLRLLRETPEQVSGIDRGLKRDTESNATATAIADAATTATSASATDDDDARRKAAGVALHDRLVAALKARRPEALEAAEAILKEEDGRRGPRGPTVLKQLVAPAVSPAPFSFNFG